MLRNTNLGGLESLDDEIWRRRGCCPLKKSEHMRALDDNLDSSLFTMQLTMYDDLNKSLAIDATVIQGFAVGKALFID